MCQVVANLLISETSGGMAAQKSLDWDSDAESWTESEGTTSSELRSHALQVIGQNWSGEKISLFLEDWEQRCPGYGVPGNA